MTRTTCPCRPNNDVPTCRARLEWREALELGYRKRSSLTGEWVDADSPLTFAEYERRRMAFREAHFGAEESSAAEL